MLLTPSYGTAPNNDEQRRLTQNHGSRTKLFGEQDEEKPSNKDKGSREERTALELRLERISGERRLTTQSLMKETTLDNERTKNQSAMDNERATRRKRARERDNHSSTYKAIKKTSSKLPNCDARRKTSDAATLELSCERKTEKKNVVIGRIVGVLSRKKGANILGFLEEKDIMRFTRFLRLSRFTRILRPSRFRRFLRLSKFTRFLHLSRFSWFLRLSKFTRFLRLSRFTMFLRLPIYKVFALLQVYEVLRLSRFTWFLYLSKKKGSYACPTKFIGYGTPSTNVTALQQNPQGCYTLY
ncbi:hypothetical protein V8G54_010383 [Vigna mungo]|uniref:Uncharacterized protein n=1 Tax=Vigna mungo TaxID=3915 RepID=A0AAQ3S6D0_VIGMU